MKVLHDWDRLTLSGKKSLTDGLSLILYAITKVIPFLNRIKWVERNTRKLESVKLAHLETLIKLDALVGVTPIFGIRDLVLDQYLDELTEIRLKYGVDMRHHFHIGSPPDPDRIRGWNPPLSQSRQSWNFEMDFIEGRGTLEPGDLPIFHVDYPENLRYYIDYLYQERAREESSF